MSNIIELNSTGSFKMIDGDYFSYSTRMSASFKGYSFINRTYYSATTRKHQANLPAVPYYRQLEYCPYGNWNIQEQIERETLYLNDTLEVLQKNKSTQGKIKEKIAFLKLLMEE